MRRKAQEPRRQIFLADYQAVVDEVYQAIQARGPIAGRDFSSEKGSQWTYRSTKASGQAFYHLWISGELMTHSRVNYQRRFDLRSRIAPPGLDHATPVAEAEAYFSRRIFHKLGMLTERSFRSWWQGECERPISPAEAHQQLDALVHSGQAVPVMLTEDPKTPRYVLAEYLPALETLAKGEIPAEWQPLETTTREEMVPLAPLGYYTLPLLYDDRLAGRLDARLQRGAGELHLLGLWLEPGETADEAYRAALAAGLKRLMRLVGAEKLVSTAGVPAELASDLEERCNCQVNVSDNR